MSDTTAVGAAPARVLYRGGSVYSPADPFATAVLVEGATVAWVGSDEAADAQAARARADGQPLAVVDLDGALVTPAFVDAHVHTTETGLAMAGVDLTGARSAADVLDAVARAAAEHPGEPVLGHGWDEAGWPGGRLPTAAELERAAGAGVEVYLARVDVHSALVSPALAARAGLPEAGRVEREAHHAARDAAQRHLRDDPTRRCRLQRRALGAAAAVGIGSVHECSAPHVGSPEDLRDLVALSRGDQDDDGSSALPEVLALWGELVADRASAEALVAQLDLPAGALLGFGGDLCVDGALGSRTALLREPYADQPGSRGHGYLDAGALRDHVLACTRAGLQAGVHAIGDAGVDVALEAFSAAAEVLAAEGAPPLAASRHRIEHAVAVDAAGIATMARLGLVASVQPAFDATWGGPDGVYAARLGRERVLGLHPFGPLAAAGVPLALGSDSPVTPFAPWEAVRAAAFPHVREHAVSARAAFLASTRGGWRAARRDGEGALVPGGAATLAVWEPSDLVVQAPDDRFQAWSTDARSGTPGLPDLTPGTPAPRCLRTLVRGRTAHDAGVLA
ncbi:amidohydrolase family protein [Streptomyces sp. NP160]|uniref:amidohydrolase n=1 Tax=Streptomyces sp. NP160 TaxID=2586637 RepID=UPI001117FAE7|nr:amidohydrolase family protein [Streptomyces sp. NP160]TNM70178.1 amidohydrolase family protein [Streptomyces sp. NP160]